MGVKKEDECEHTFNAKTMVYVYKFVYKVELIVLDDDLDKFCIVFSNRFHCILKGTHVDRYKCIYIYISSGYT